MRENLMNSSPLGLRAKFLDFVVKLGADSEIKDVRGKTAKEICAEHGI